MAKLEIEVKLDIEALVKELKEAAEKIEAEEMEQAEQDRPGRWIFDWQGMTCSKCYTIFSDELMYVNRENAIDWVPTFCPECGAKLGHGREKKEASE